MNGSDIQCQAENSCVYFSVLECHQFTATVTIFGDPGQNLGMCSDSEEIGCGSTHFIWSDATDTIIGKEYCFWIYPLYI